MLGLGVPAFRCSPVLLDRGPGPAIRMHRMVPSAARRSGPLGHRTQRANGDSVDRPRGTGHTAGRSTRVSSTQMAELIINDKDLVVHLTLGEKIGSFHGDIRVRLSAIVSVAPDPQPWLTLR